MGYATIANLESRFDRRVLAQLSNDAGGTSANTANQTTAIDDASAEILMAALQGGIYTSDQLDTLYAAGDKALIRLTCFLAAKNLYKRRGMGVPPSLKDDAKQADDLLEQLRKGMRVFNVSANRSGELPAIVSLTSTQQNNLGSLTDSTFFPDSATRNVNGNG